MMARLMGLAVVAPEEVLRRVRAGEATVLDVNAPASFARAHVPGACHLDHAALQPSDLPPDPAAPLVFYCSNPWCRKAPLAARRARALGHRDVAVMAAGIQGWLERGLPVEGSGSG